MTLQLTRDEREFLLELLKAAHPEMQHELHHTDTLDYREGLRRRIEMPGTPDSADRRLA